MRKLIVFALVVGCLGVLASVAMAATKSVKVGDDYYVRPKRRAEGDRHEGHDGQVATSAGRRTRTRSRVSKGPSKFNSGAAASGSYTSTLKKRGHLHGSTARSTAPQTRR